MSNREVNMYIVATDFSSLLDIVGHWRHGFWAMWEYKFSIVCLSECGFWVLGHAYDGFMAIF